MTIRTAKTILLLIHNLNILIDLQYMILLPSTLNPSYFNLVTVNFLEKKNDILTIKIFQCSINAYSIVSFTTFQFALNISFLSK